VVARECLCFLSVIHQTGWVPHISFFEMWVRRILKEPLPHAGSTTTAVPYAKTSA